ncbi:hypothetical protein B0O99DRAFT_626052 [Bisporella sp. PMI_857]|nr:hypothetical protein B0O99DRAFT_626052 [Bisporella sp. PMI_857]
MLFAALKQLRGYLRWPGPPASEVIVPSRGSSDSSNRTSPQPAAEASIESAREAPPSPSQRLTSISNQEDESYTFPITIADRHGKLLTIMALYNSSSLNDYMSLYFANRLELSSSKLDSSNASYVVTTWSSPKLGRYGQRTTFLISEKGNFKILFGRRTGAERTDEVRGDNRKDPMDKSRVLISFDKGIKEGLLYRVVLSDGEPSGSSLADVEARLQPEEALLHYNVPSVAEESATLSYENDKTQMPIMLDKYLQPDSNRHVQVSPMTPPATSLEEGSASPLTKFQENIELIQSTFQNITSSTPGGIAGLSASQSSQGTDPQKLASIVPKTKKISHTRKSSRRSSSNEERSQYSPYPQPYAELQTCSELSTNEQLNTAKTAEQVPRLQQSKELFKQHGDAITSIGLQTPETPRKGADGAQDSSRSRRTNFCNKRRK